MTRHYSPETLGSQSGRWAGYGYAVNAYAVESPDARVFRSLCVLYEGVQLGDYVRAKELRAELSTISRDLSAGRDVGRFTLPEAILACEDQ